MARSVQLIDTANTHPEQLPKEQCRQLRRSKLLFSQFEVETRDRNAPRSALRELFGRLQAHHAAGPALVSAFCQEAFVAVGNALDDDEKRATEAAYWRLKEIFRGKASERERLLAERQPLP